MTQEEKIADYDKLCDAMWANLKKTGVSYKKEWLPDILMELAERLVKYEEAAQLFVEEIEEIKNDNSR